MIVLVFNFLFFNRGKTSVNSNKKKKIVQKKFVKEKCEKCGLQNDTCNSLGL